MKIPRSPASDLLLDYVFESPFAFPCPQTQTVVSFCRLAYVPINSLIFPASKGALLGIERLSYPVTTEFFHIK